MSKFSYLPREMKVHTENGVHFLFDAAHVSLPIYFALKGKHSYELLGGDEFISQVKSIVEQMAANYDVIVFPESRYPFLRQITKDISHATELKKRSKDEICSLVMENKSWKKQDKVSAEKAWSEMGDAFTINLIKANKRKDYVPFLFDNIQVPDGSKVLLLDDFVMSGRTIEAMAAALNIKDYETFGIFYQRNY